MFSGRDHVGGFVKRRADVFILANPVILSCCSVAIEGAALAAGAIALRSPRPLR